MTMARPLKALTPERSPRDRFGARLRDLRVRKRLSQNALARLIRHSPEIVGAVERAERWPTQELARRCDDVLGAGGELLNLWPVVDKMREASDGRRRRVRRARSQ
ncbi:helix-turn-helix transcriptional regulator [Plantactinospora sp. WMMB334]|uniref:helix-turn-helix transcriptional regulator n=1 Tax=Plantactinospora sp. WMMB334 TaxID=3404119 RepID=UPI003B94470A